MTFLTEHKVLKRPNKRHKNYIYTAECYARHLDKITFKAQQAVWWFRREIQAMKQTQIRLQSLPIPIQNLILEERELTYPEIDCIAPYFGIRK